MSHAQAQLHVLSRCQPSPLPSIPSVGVDAELHCAGTIRRGADATTRVATNETRGADGFATLLSLGNAQLLRAPLPGFHADAARRVAALEPGLADGRAALPVGGRGDWNGRADMRRAHHAGFGAEATRRVAAGQAGLAHRVPTLDAADGDALGLAVNHLACGGTGALDRGTRRDCVARDRIDWTTVNGCSHQDGQQHGCGGKGEDGHDGDLRILHGDSTN